MGHCKMLEQTKRESEQITGVSNVTYDAFAVLTRETFLKNGYRLPPGTYGKKAA